MATLTHHESATAEQLVVTDGARKTFIAIIAAGVLLLIVGILAQVMGWGAAEHGEAAGHAAAAHGAAHEEGHSVLIKRLIVSLWHSNLFFLGVSTVGTVFMAINYVAYAGWSVMVKRISEALSAWVIPGGVIMLIVFLVGRQDIFHWTHDGIMDPKSEHFDAIIKGKEGFLNLPFYVIRMVSYLVIWGVFSWKLRQLSLAEDLNGGTYWFHKSITASALFLVLYAVTSSMSAWDWVMSVDTHWFSTMFGWYVFASWWVSGIAAIALTAIFLKQNGYLRALNASHIHDLGKLMFGFSIFWTYVWFAQFMLIWYANLPEEAVYFNQRLGGFEGRYTFMFFFNIAINFVFPFLGLMTRDAKRQMIIMKIVAIAILCGHWSDFYLMLMPATLRGENGFLIEIGIAAIFLGAFLILFTRRLASASLVPVNHPFLDESVHHTT
ncbi:quinol:cytochrome C oxidoreductase [Hymenobacter sp. DH14]|uniref:Quinol:cytochrome C oxidoreductase n=1 Tax=Hymenobacter cyanobacteriorum TaxID=2926463 RepID=A0A9X1VE80_9BACT|nr:quinol:cytochrome C oxidoreductase [Hymenobacter cyanobacteriorum]MCI1186483.1 quinol:cytochrome C oxidoreductase [Hymenobacter cyanobacteriorum]